MVVTFNGATYGAALAVLPVFAFDYFVGSGMGTETSKIFFLDCWIVVKSEHDVKGRKTVKNTTKED